MCPKVRQILDFACTFAGEILETRRKNICDAASWFEKEQAVGLIFCCQKNASAFVKQRSRRDCRTPLYIVVNDTFPLARHYRSIT